MKRYLLIACLFFLAFSSCKKLEVSANQTYVEQGKTGGELGFGGIMLTLEPDGRASLLNGGDVWYSGTYKIKGNKVTATIENKTYKFDVVSNSELRYEKTRILVLDPRYN